MRNIDPTIRAGFAREVERAGVHYKIAGRAIALEVVSWPATAPNPAPLLADALLARGYRYYPKAPVNAAVGKAIFFKALPLAPGDDTLAGYWIQREDLHLLVWGRFAAPKPPAADLFAKLPPLQGRNGVAKGRVLDGRGRPVAGARVIMRWPQDGEWKGGSTMVRTDARGVYYFPVMPFRLYTLEAYTNILFDGKRFRLDGLPVGSVAPVGKSVRGGVVQNFVLSASGLRQIAGTDPDPHRSLSYRGGRVLVEADRRLTRPEGDEETTVVTFTLIPRGPLADSTGGTPHVFRRTLRALRTEEQEGAYLWETRTLPDIPLGTYTVRATLSLPGQPDVALRLAAEEKAARTTPAAEETILRFTPGSGGSIAPTRLTLGLAPASANLP